MTLVMVAGLGSAFTLMTSDERLAHRFSDDRVEAIEGERELKNYPLTNTVLFGWGGNQKLARKIRARLIKAVSPDDPLETCKYHLEQITSKMNLSNNVAIILTGFYSDGTTGMVMSRTDSPIQESKSENLMYDYFMFPPTGDYSDRQDEFFYVNEFTPNVIVEEFPKLGYGGWLEKSIEIAVNHLIQVHGIISYQEPVATTPEGFYYLMYKDAQGAIRTLSGAYDTTSLHQHLKEQEARSKGELVP